ncbi:MAG: 3'-5' exonuclease [Clostridiales bacterium]|nr:3'-5' exonuclease [Clostridiales bacterium]
MPAKNGATWKTKSIWPEIRNVLTGKDTIVVFDLETTGLSSKNDRIIEIAAVKYRIGEGFSMTEAGTLHSYINPNCSLPEKITEITGITEDMLENAPCESEIFDEVKAFFDSALVGGYNVDNFDCKFMNEYFGRMGCVFNYPGSVDCLKMARNLLCKGQDVVDHKLESVGKYFGLDFQAHSAIDDARTTGALLQMFLREYMQLDAMPEEIKTGTLQPIIKKIAFWEGFQGFSRIYVETDVGSVYYDIRRNEWGGKDVDIRDIDMCYLEEEVYNLLDVENESEFAKFKGTLSVA